MNLFEQIINQSKLGTPWQFSGGTSFGSINTQDFQSKAPTIQKSLQAEQNLRNQGFSDKEVKFLKLQKEKWVDMNQAFAFVEQKRKEEAQAKNPNLWVTWGIKEWVIWATQFWQQAPSAVGNILDFTQKYVTTPLIAGGLEAIWAEWAAQKWRSAWEKFWKMAKESWEQFSSEAMQAFWPLTENQLKARQTGANLALTAPLPLGKVPSIIKGAWLAPTIARGAYYGAVGTPAYTAVSEWRLPTGGEMVAWTVWGAVAWPLLEKAIIPAVWGIASKTAKYGEALVKWGTEWLKKSVSRDLSGIPKAIQSKAEAISTRANRFNALDEEKFTKQIGETPWQFAVSRGMNDVWDDAIIKANQNYQKSIQEADKSIWAIEGNFSTKWQKDDIIWELVWANKAKMELQPRNPDANKARQLFNKYESWEGLTMAEINEAKRIYQRNHTYTYEQLASNEARNSKYLQDWVREWQFKTAKENGLTNIADINKTTKAWKMWADSLAKKINRSQANNEFGITDWIALSGGTPENIALFLWKKALSSKYVKSGIIKTLGKQTKPSIIEWTNVWVQQANFQKNVNRGISNNRGDVGGKSMVRTAWLLPAPSGKATWARNFRATQQTEKTPINNEWQRWARPITPKKPEAQKLLPAPRIPAWTSIPRTDIVAESMRWVKSKRPEWVTPKPKTEWVKPSPKPIVKPPKKVVAPKKENTPIVKKEGNAEVKPTIIDDIKYENEIFKQKKEIIEQLKSKEGERFAKKWGEQVDVLFPDKTNIVKYGKKWITYKEWDKYYFSAFSNTDSPKWSKSFKMDVTDEFLKPSPTLQKSVVVPKKKEVTPIVKKEAVKPNERSYNLIAVNERTWEKTILTKTPTTQDKAITMKNKFSDREWRRIQLEEVTPKPIVKNLQKTEKSDMETRKVIEYKHPLLQKSIELLKSHKTKEEFEKVFRELANKDYKFQDAIRDFEDRLWKSMSIQELYNGIKNRTIKDIKTKKIIPRKWSTDDIPL